VISKTLIYVLIFLALMQLGFAYYIEPVSDDVTSQQKVVNKIKSETPEVSKLAVLFESQQALIESKNDIISTSLSFHKTVGWLFLIFLVMHLLSLTRRSNSQNNNEI
jgi:quinol-cytochrome oxidoreductase complex cytochrome b subunit